MIRVPKKFFYNSLRINNDKFFHLIIEFKKINSVNSNKFRLIIFSIKSLKIIFFKFNQTKLLIGFQEVHK